MIYRLLADFVVVAHLLFILFGLFGALLALRWKWAMLLHLPAAIWIGIIEFSGRPCPLTPLEKNLRIAGGEAGYPGGFIEYYLIPIIYPPGLTPQMQTLLGIVAVSWNIVLYVFVLCRWQRKKAGKFNKNF